MNHVKLNNLVFSYQRTGNESTFEKIYKAVYAEWTRTNAMRSLGRKHRLSENDVEGIANETIIKSLKEEAYRDDRSNYFNLLRKMLSNACADERRKQDIFRRAGSTDEITSEDGNLEVSDVLGDEDEGFEDFERKSDQRQLIAELMEKATDKCRQALIAFSETDNYYDAGKRLGIRNVTLKNRVEKIAELFDSSKWGDINDYLTGTDTQQNEFLYPYQGNTAETEEEIPENPVVTYSIF